MNAKVLGLMARGVSVKAQRHNEELDGAQPPSAAGIFLFIDGMLLRGLLQFDGEFMDGLIDLKILAVSP